MLITVVIAPGCDVMLGISDEPIDAQCVPDERQCRNNRPQKCVDYIWQDDEPCPNSTPVCTLHGACSKVTMLAAGGNHACGLIDLDKSIRCWGGNESGQLGSGTTTAVDSSVTVLGLKNVKQIRAGGYDDKGFTCAIDANDKVFCWGDNNNGQLGTGDKQTYLAPISVEGTSGVTHLGLGSRHTCAVVESGTVQCWGWDTVTAWIVPTSISPLPPMMRVEAGARHTCALGVNGDVYCWGYNGDGQCGQPLDEEFVQTPKKVVGISGAYAISAGYFHTCALSQDQVFCWGRNDCGQLGRGTYCGEYCPLPKEKKACGEFQPAPALTGQGIIADLDLGADHSCVIGTSGAINCWGRNDYRQAGENGQSIIGHGANFYPVPSMTGFTHATFLSVGAYFGCITTDTRGTHCWGRNDFGQLGTDEAVKW